MTAIVKASSALQQLILDVRNPTNGAVADAQGVLIYQTVDNTQELAATAGNYNAATGIYTVPASGHKNVKIKAAVSPQSGGIGSLNLLRSSIQINGVVRATRADMVAASVPVTQIIELDIKNLVAGDTVKVVGTTPNSGAYMSNGGNADYLKIFATS